MGVHIASATSGERPEKLIMGYNGLGRKMQDVFVYKPTHELRLWSGRESSLAVT